MKQFLPILSVVVTVFVAIACGGSAESKYTHPEPKIVVDSSVCPDDQVSGEDTYFSLQWHLENSDLNLINAPAIWASYQGDGISVAVVDDGLEVRHDDLCGNVYFEKNYNFNDGTNDPSPPSSDYFHGTRVSGISNAIGNNSLGVSGVAPLSRVMCFNAIDKSGSYLINIYDALSRSLDTVDIYNNSWGPDDSTHEYSPMYSLVQDAITEGLATGRNGKGAVYVWSNGNGGSSGDLSTYDGFASFYGVIPVGAINDAGEKQSYSENGSNLWVVTYSKIYTTDLDNSYYQYFDGTSASAPVASGIIALMLEANPALTWRDVKLILAETAYFNDSDDTEWETNNAESPVHINYKYGFGAIDAEAAVDAAESWSLVGPMLTYSSTKSVNSSIPNNNTTGVSSSITISSGQTTINKIEYVTAEVTIDHPSGGELEIVLTSDKGGGNVTESIFSEQRQVYYLIEKSYIAAESTYFDGGNSFTFGTSRCLNEDPDGEWTLTVRDCSSANTSTGKLQKWKLTIYGRE